MDLQTLVEQEKSKINIDMSVYRRYLAYTHNDGPDDVEEWAGPKRFMRLRKTPVWKLLIPLRVTWHGMQFLYVHGVKGLGRKIQNAKANSKRARRKAGAEYLEKIMPNEDERKRQREETFLYAPVISILVPLYNTPERFLRDMIESVTNQTYQNWELCLADASNDGTDKVERIVREYAGEDSRIVYEKLAKNGGIADNTNECIRMSTGEYIALFDHDDILHPSALYECVKTINQEKSDFVYTDEVTFEGEELENIITYHFKPDYSVDNLRGVNYICHLSVFRRSLVDEVGMFSNEYDGSQDHDLIMRLTEKATVVSHVPKVLYFWRCHKMSTSMNLDAKSYAIDAGRRAVRDAEARRGYPAEVFSAQICKTHYRMKYEMKDPVITVMVNGDGYTKEQIAHTIASIEKQTSYQKVEIGFFDKYQSLKQEMEQASGKYIVLIEAGAEIITPTWLEELLMFAQRMDVGIVGMHMLDDNNRILSSDIVMGHKPEVLIQEINEGEAFDAPGYMGRFYYAHNVTAVSGCGCMVKKSLLLELLDTKFDTLKAGMIDFCLAVRSAKGNVVVNPYALAKMPAESYRAEVTQEDEILLWRKHKKQLQQRDPYYNKNLSYERHWQRK